MGAPASKYDNLSKAYLGIWHEAEAFSGFGKLVEDGLEDGRFSRLDL